MPVEFLQFGVVAAVFLAVALLWFRFVYKARRTGEGDGTRSERRSGDRLQDRDEEPPPAKD